MTPTLVSALERLGRGEEAAGIRRRALAVAPGDGRLAELNERPSAPRGPEGGAAVRGVVKVVLRHERGYRFGFIEPDGRGGADIYFREGPIDSECVNRLAKGVRVEVEAEPGGKGPRATRIRVVDGE